MNASLIQTFKLAGPAGDGFHAYLNEKGAFMGRGVPLLERDAFGSYQPRAQAELERLFGAGYGIPIELDWRMAQLHSVAQAVNQGNLALASIALVHMRLPPIPSAAHACAMAKADGRTFKYNPDWEDEPRVPSGSPAGGQWTTGGNEVSGLVGEHDNSSYLIDVAYQGGYHDQVVKTMADYIRSKGGKVETSVPLTSLDGRITAVADLMVENPSTGEVYVLEVKTGKKPTFTPSQRYIYPMVAVGGHVYSNSPKIASFGFIPGHLLPPIRVDAVYAVPGEPLRWIPQFPEFE